MRAYASRVIHAPIDIVWDMLRAFDRLYLWHAAVVDGSIDDGLDAATVGAVRSFHLADGSLVQERLVSLDVRNKELAYEFVTPAFAVDHYLARMRVSPITADGSSFVEWWADFDEPTGREGQHAELIADKIFADGLSGLETYLNGTRR